MADWSHVRTDRLSLSPLGELDVDELFALTSGPATSRLDPALRHTDRQRAADLVRRADEGRRLHGLAPWAVRWSATGTPPEETPTGASRRPAPGATVPPPPAASPTLSTLVGLGGCSLLRGVAWNLGYRLAPQWWGRGLAQEVIAAARRAATDVRPDLPVIAAVLETNTPSWRTAELAGLERVWSGSDARGPDPRARLLLLADRPLGEQVLATLTAT